MTKSFLLLGLSLLTVFSSANAAEPVNLKPLEVRDVQVRTPIGDQRGFVTVYFNLAEGHHAYIQQFKLVLDSPTEIFLSEPIVSPVVDFMDPVSKKNKKGTEGNGTLVSTLEVPEAFRKAAAQNEVPLKLTLTYQACTKDYCLFPVKIPVEAKLFLDGSSAKKQSANEKFASQIEDNFWLTLVLIFFAGILTSFTPCIFPMIPITLAVLGAKDSGKTRLSGFFLSFSYVMGIALTYAILGVLAAKTGALFGSFLGSPIVAIVLAMLFVGMAFSMWGFYEIKLPDRLTNKIMGSNPSHSASGVVAAFVSGLVAGVVASPCVGPVLVSILAYVAKTQDGTLGFVLLFVYALGFGQIFLVMGTFSQLIHRLPRSGPWLDKTKYAFGALMIAMALYVLWPIVNPYFVSTQGVTPSSCANESEDGLSCLPEKPLAGPEWKKYDEKLLAEAIASKRPVIIDFKADWCLACKELEHKTFSDKRVVELGRDFLWMDFDATSDSPELTALRAKYEILGLPFVMFYDAKGEWRKDLTLTGFEEAEPFLVKMKAAAQK